MTQDQNIPLAARNFVQRFGKTAPEEAKKRAEELLAAGNQTSHATWMMIYEEVKVLLSGANDNPTQ